jgi:PAS domain S-box-containing protein
MALLDSDLRYLRTNRRFATITGREPDEYVGRRPRDLFHHEVASLVEVAAAYVFAHGIPIDNQEIVCTSPHGDDESITWLVSYYPVWAAGGPPRAVGVVMTDISERKRAERKLEASIREKDALLQEIRHRVKNNLQVIASLLDLHAMSTGDARVGAAFGECQRRVRSMALVHELLSSTDERMLVHFPTYVDMLLHYLRQMYSGLAAPELHAAVADVGLDTDTSVPCALIISELVVNAVKHAFPDMSGGAIWVTVCERDGGALELTVRDNGVGLPPGMASRRADAIGLRLVATLARQLHGSVTQHNDSGAVVSVRFTPRLAARKG